MSLSTHLRSNAVAYVALLAATCGTSYAVVALPPGSVTTAALAKDAVTAPKVASGTVAGADLAAGAVRGSVVRDRTLTRADFRAGAVPTQPFVDAATTGTQDPSATPLLTLSTHFDFVARAGTLYFRFRAKAVRVNCGAGIGYVGLAVDRVPLPGTLVLVSSDPPGAPLDLVGTVPVSTGAHKLEVTAECHGGTYVDSALGSLEYTDLVF